MLSGTAGALAQPTTTPAPTPSVAPQSAPAEQQPPADPCATPVTTTPTTTSIAPPTTTTSAAPTPSCATVPATPQVTTPAAVQSTTTSLPAQAPAPAPAEQTTPADVAPAQLPSEPAADQPIAPENDELSSKTAEPDPDWTPTDNPNLTVVPGAMRSDREEIPAGATKEMADKAETMEARQRMSRAAAGCQTYWPFPYEVCGVIRDKYNSLGGPSSFLSYPNSPEYTNPDGFGKRTQFLNGPIYWSAATGAHPVVNSFLNRWGIHRFEAGWLAYPTTDEVLLPDGGRRQEFQGGAIYVAFQNAIGSAIHNGPVRDKWNSLGAESAGSVLGYITGDEIDLPDGYGRMARFERGVIYWTPNTLAHAVTEPILTLWANTGYEQGEWQYPISDRIDLGGGKFEQRFQDWTASYPLVDAADPVTNWNIKKSFFTDSGDDVPLRFGRHDGARTGFGWFHIQDRRHFTGEGQTEETFMAGIQKALDSCPKDPKPGFNNTIHCIWIDRTNKASKWHVIWSDEIVSESFDGRPKGIITAYSTVDNCGC